ncbi:MAG TPA: carboxypeptidase regulatory-like domain-containing protein, partial [bacterium]|nr:carboxypeptidase regulatory-like domain-containing protein [bacterium]
VAGGFAFVADSDSGLTVIDVSNPASPVIVGSLDTPWSAEKIEVGSGLAYISGSHEVRVIDVNDPRAPAQISSIASGWSEHVCVSGNLAFVVDNYWPFRADLHIIDASDPRSPAQVGQYTTWSHCSADLCFLASGLAVAGGYALITVWDQRYSMMQDQWYYCHRLEVVDVSNPLEIKQVGGLLTGSRFPGPVCAIAGFALMCLDDGRVQAIDARDPSHVAVFSEIQLSGTLNDIMISGGYAYVAAGKSGLFVLGSPGPPGSVIAGMVRGECGDAVAGVVVELDGAATKGVVTAETGTYRFDKLEVGDYTVTPWKPGLVFAPPSRSYDSLTSDQLGQDFVWENPGPAHAIAGTVWDGSGGPLSDVIVNITGCGWVTDTTGVDGAYEFDRLTPTKFTYEVAPERRGWVFIPPARQYPGLTSDSIDQDFTGHWVGFSISGRVVADSGSGEWGVPDVAVTLSGDADMQVMTDASGNYDCAGLSPGVYDVAPSKAGWNFTPLSRHYPHFHMDMTGEDFVGVAEKYTVSGVIRDGSGNRLEGMVVRAAGQRAAVDTTGVDGVYVLAGLEAGDYVVSPSKVGWVFSPERRSYSPLASDQSDQDFAAQWVGVGISGCVSGPGDEGVGGVRIELAGDASRIDTTDAAGCYAFTGLEPGSYSVAPSRLGWMFEPSVRQYPALATSQAEQDFTGTVVAFVRVSRAVGGAVRIEALPGRAGSLEVTAFAVTGQRLWRTEVEASLGEPSVVEWNCENAAGRRVASGVYILRVTGAGLDETKKITVVR